MTTGRNWNRRTGRTLLAVVMAAAGWTAFATSDARACDKKQKSPRVILQTSDPVDDGGAEAELLQRLEELEAEMNVLHARAAELRAHRRQRHAVAPPSHVHAMPHMPAMPTMPTMPTMPRMPEMPSFPQVALDADDAAEAMHEWQGELREWRSEWQEQWQEAQQEWREEFREAMEEWREHHQELAEDWRERAQDMTHEWAERGWELQERIRDRAERQFGRQRDRADRAERRPRSESRRRGPRADRGAQGQAVYGVTGREAETLYELLAPSYVRVIVSRAGEHIAVRASGEEHEALNAGLQLLGWIDRDEVFDEMGEGKKVSRKYVVGKSRAKRLYEMLAPNEVRVVVSHAGKGTVSVRGTEREQEVLRGFLDVLNWESTGG